MSPPGDHSASIYPEPTTYVDAGAYASTGQLGRGRYQFSGTSSATTRIGYWMVDSSGTVYPFGGAEWLGNAPTSSAVHVEPTPTRNGYWIVDASGRVFARCSSGLPAAG